MRGVEEKVPKLNDEAERLLLRSTESPETKPEKEDKKYKTGFCHCCNDTVMSFFYVNSPR